FGYSVAAGRSTMFNMRVHHNSIFRKYPGRIYDEGEKTIVYLVDIDEVSIEKMNTLMARLGDQLTLMECLREFISGTSNAHVKVLSGTSNAHVIDEASTTSASASDGAISWLGTNGTKLVATSEWRETQATYLIALSITLSDDDKCLCLYVSWEQYANTGILAGQPHPDWSCSYGRTIMLLSIWFSKRIHGADVDRAPSIFFLVFPIDLNEKVNGGVETKPICDSVTRRGNNDDSGMSLAVRRPSASASLLPQHL
ncbi:hypothetical protein Tco_0157388, partial [Tanacetum coccineum]